MKAHFAFILVSLICGGCFSKSSLFLNTPDEAFLTLLDAVNQIINEFLAVKLPTIHVISETKAFDETAKLSDFINFLMMKSFASSKFSVRQENLVNLAKISNQKRSSSVFIIDGFHNFTEMFSQITPNGFWLSGFYVVILINGETSEVNAMLKLFWKVKIHNVVVIFQENSEVFVKTFMPFNSESCYDTTPKLVNHFKDGNFLSGFEKLFPEKMKNLHGCPVRVAIGTSTDPSVVIKRLSNGSHHLSGRDIKLIHTLSESLNFRINYTFIGAHAFFYENGSASGPL